MGISEFSVNPERFANLSHGGIIIT